MPGVKRSKALAGAERRWNARDCWTASETRTVLKAAWLAADEAIPNDASGGERGLHSWIATEAQTNDEAGNELAMLLPPSKRCKMI